MMTIAALVPSLIAFAILFATFQTRPPLSREANGDRRPY